MLDDNDDMFKSRNKIIVYVLQVRADYLTIYFIAIYEYSIGPKGEKVCLGFGFICMYVNYGNIVYICRVIEVFPDFL